MAKTPLVISFAGLRTKTDIPPSIYDTVPIENLWVCPESGVFFPVYDAFIKIDSIPCKDPRTFFCPACGSRLRINAPPKSPVAECRKCTWFSDSDRFKSLPDLLLCEKNPFSSETSAFDSLVRTIQLGTDHEVRSYVPRKSAQAPGKARPSSLSNGSEVECREDAKVPELLPCSGGNEVDFDCCVSSVRESKASEYEASNVTAAFSGRICIKNCLPANDRFSVRNWSRASMPPRRGLVPSKYTIHSPFPSKHPQLTESARQAAVKASTVVPSFSVAGDTVDVNRVVLSARNCCSTPLHIDLELQHGHSPSDRSPERSEVSWVGAHAADLSAKGGNHEFVLQVDDISTVQVEIVLCMQFSHNISEAESEPARKHLEWSNQTWECRMVISRPKPLAGLRCGILGPG